MSNSHDADPSKITNSNVKYAVVTGCSLCSIGFLAAQKLASPPYHFFVILACRNATQGHLAEERIQKSYPDAQVKYLQLDLACRASIKEFVRQLHELPDFDRNGLSILVNNAGIGWGLATSFRKTQDGLEEIVGVNHFGTFFLTYQLLGDLKRAQDARIVVVSSGLHDPNTRPTTKNKEDKDQDVLLLPDFPTGILPCDDEKYDGSKAYRVSKLCNVWFAYELQRLLDKEGTSSVRVNAVSPGFIPSTGLSRHAGWMVYIFLNFFLDPWRHFGLGVTRSPEDGAEVIVQAATSTIAAKGGEYFHLPKGETDIAPLQSSVESYDEAKASKLWQISLEICNLV